MLENVSDALITSKITEMENYYGHLGHDLFSCKTDDYTNAVVHAILNSYKIRSCETVKDHFFSSEKVGTMHVNLEV